MVRVDTLNNHGHRGLEDVPVPSGENLGPHICLSEDKGPHICLSEDGGPTFV